MIEARITKAATSKISVALGDRRVEHEQREQHRGDALRAEPGDEGAVLAAALRRRRNESTTATGRATSRAKAMKTTSSGHAAAVADADDHRAEDEEGQRPGRSS